MLFLQVFLVCCLAAVALASPISVQFTNDSQSAWNSFVTSFGKSYGPDLAKRMIQLTPAVLRQLQFLANYEAIKAHNAEFMAGRKEFSLSLNQFADMSPEEVVRKFTGVIEPKKLPILPGDANDQPPFNISKVLDPAPANVDWRNAVPRVLSPVRNQGQCGSCWAFSTIATVEAAYNIKANAYRANFSEQNLIDCDYEKEQGCNGGWPNDAFTFLRDNGVTSNVPYKGCANMCPGVSNTNKPSFAEVDNVDDDTLRSLIAKYGPLTVVMDASDVNLQYYSSGVLSLSCKEVNHGVNVVGYATTGPGAPYWILRNSWGRSWGEGGYFRLSANSPCLIKSYVWYATY